MVQVSYTRQKEPLGLGHAVLVARDLVGDEPFAVLLGDVLIPGPNPATKQLIKVYEATGVGAIAVEEVPKTKRIFTASWMANLLRSRLSVNACCAFATWSKSPSRKTRHRILALPGATFCRQRFSIA